MASDSAQSAEFLIEVIGKKLSLDKCHDFVVASCCGAVSTFVGITRDNFEGKKVKKLSYEGYVPMAVKELLSLCEQARRKFEIHKIAVQHILGECPVGHASVVIAVSSAHRRASLDCVSFMIDELKRNVPIWKKEIYDGDTAASWKENAEWNARKQKN
jgi:molybdopterin synthase catalytic subunit